MEEVSWRNNGGLLRRHLIEKAPVSQVCEDAGDQAQDHTRAGSRGKESPITLVFTLGLCPLLRAWSSRQHTSPTVSLPRIVAPDRTTHPESG